MNNLANQSRGSIWPKAIIGYFAFVITCMIIFVVWIVRQNNDLVRPDYYAEELRFQKQMERVHRTHNLDTRASIVFDESDRKLHIKIPEEHAGKVSSGMIHLYRPSDAKLDQNLPLALAPDGEQQIDATHLEAGLWRVRVFWKLNDEEFFHDDSIVVSGGFNQRSTEVIEQGSYGRFSPGKSSYFAENIRSGFFLACTFFDVLTGTMNRQDACSTLVRLRRVVSL